MLNRIEIGTRIRVRHDLPEVQIGDTGVIIAWYGRAYYHVRWDKSGEESVIFVSHVERNESEGVNDVK